MGCISAVLTGIAIDCGNAGGIKKIYIAPVEYVTVTVTGDEVATIIMEASQKFKTYSFRKGNASFVTNGNRDDKQGTYFAKTDVSLQFNKMEKFKRKEIQELIKGNVYVIVEDNNGEKWFIGYDSYVSVETATGQTGEGMADGNFYSLVLSSESPELPYTIASTVVLTEMVG